MVVTFWCLGNDEIPEIVKETAHRSKDFISDGNISDLIIILW